jgi:hypothetical protein
VTIPFRPGVLVKHLFAPFISELDNVRIDHVELKSADLLSTRGAIVDIISSGSGPNAFTYRSMLIPAFPLNVLDISI